MKRVVLYPTQHRGKADAVENFVTDSSKEGESCVLFHKQACRGVRG